MIGLVLALIMVLVPAPYDRLGTCGQRLVDHHNRVRVEAGLRPLVVDWRMHRYALAHSRDMRSEQTLRHSTYPRYGENVGQAPDRLTLEAAWMESPGHRDNILTRWYRYIGPGCAHEPGRVWGTVTFR